MICNNCGRVFDEPAKAFEYHSEVDTRREKTYSICPYCESEEIEESDTCPVCGSDKPATEDYCEACGDTITSIVSGYVTQLKETYQIDYKTAVEWLQSEIERRAG